MIQSNSYSCGVGVVQAVLSYHGIWGYQDVFAQAMGTTPEQGTHPARMVAFMKEKGLDAQLREGLTIDELRRFVDEGVLVILDIQAYHDDDVDYATDWEDGHYVILLGYNKDVLFLEDPSLLGTRTYLTNAELMTRWRDYETENGARREYRQSGIVVRARPRVRPTYSHQE